MSNNKYNPILTIKKPKSDGVMDKDKITKQLLSELNFEKDLLGSSSGSNPLSFFGAVDESVFLNGQHLYFSAKVSGSTVEKLIKLINEVNTKFNDCENNKFVKRIKPNPLYLHITSYGGDLLACFRAIDAIQRSRVPVYTIIEGHAASAATLMSVVGKKRYMTPTSYMLIHQLSSGAMGKFWEIKDDYKNCKMWMEKIYQIYTKNTNMTREQLEKYLSHDSWWDVDKCLETGLIDDSYVEDV